jgi:hypothetical protein
MWVSGFLVVEEVVVQSKPAPVLWVVVEEEVVSRRVPLGQSMMVLEPMVGEKVVVGRNIQEPLELEQSKPVPGLGVVVVVGVESRRVPWERSKLAWVLSEVVVGQLVLSMLVLELEVQVRSR